MAHLTALNKMNGSDDLCLVKICCRKLTRHQVESTLYYYAVLSVRFEVGVSLLLAPAGADKRGQKAPFPLVGYAGIQPAGAGSY